MKNLFTMIGILLFSSFAFAGFQGFQSTTNLGVFNKIKCSTGLTCTKVGDKMQFVASQSALTGPITVSGALTGDGTGSLSGFKQAHVTATATTITAAQCGSTFKNSGAVVINLPEASAVIGCRLTFITANASNFDVNPDNADQILVQTNAAGDAIRNATLGNAIMLEAISASEWAPVSVQGTWSDIN